MDFFPDKDVLKLPLYLNQSASGPTLHESHTKETLETREESKYDKTDSCCSEDQTESSVMFSIDGSTEIKTNGDRIRARSKPKFKENGQILRADSLTHSPPLSPLQNRLVLRRKAGSLDNLDEDERCSSSDTLDSHSRGGSVSELSPRKSHVGSVKRTGWLSGLLRTRGTKDHVSNEGIITHRHSHDSSNTDDLSPRISIDESK